MNFSVKYHKQKNVDEYLKLYFQTRRQQFKARTIKNTSQGEPALKIRDRRHLPVQLRIGQSTNGNKTID